MNNFHTDWSAMTWNDWIGLSITVITAVLLCLLYLYVFKPGNKERLNSYGSIPLDPPPDEEEPDAE